MFRRLPFIILLLHVYVGWRLLPELLSNAAGFGATALWLAASLIATPLWPLARRVTRQPLRDRLMGTSMLAMGSFSSLFVLTLFRDVALGASAVLGAHAVETALRHDGALAVTVMQEGLIRPVK